MNNNIKEIGHVSFRLKYTERFRQYYENVLGLKTAFCLRTENGEPRIIYYQLNRGQFIEIFPETSTFKWSDYDGHNHDADYSYQYTTIGIGRNPQTMVDPEGNSWKINPGEHYISKVTYHSKDLEKQKKFYKDVLGLDLVTDTPEKLLVRVNDFQTVELLYHPYSKDNCTNNKGQCHYALIVKDITKMARMLETLKIQLWHGPKLQKMPYTEPYQPEKHSENSYNFYIQDPDDNEIEIMGYSEDSLQLKYAAQ